MKKAIIAIGRQYGSEGRKIGQKLAADLNIPFYDKEILSRAAEESGLYAGLFSGYDEKTKGLMLNMISNNYSLGPVVNSNEVTVDRMVMQAVFDTLRNIAKEGSCVIIGRCADYILEKDPALLSAFIYAPMEDRIKTVMERSNIKNSEEARRIILRTDRQRASYYNFYTMKKWGRVESYDVCLNSSVFGVDGTVNLLKEIVLNKE